MWELAGHPLRSLFGEWIDPETPAAAADEQLLADAAAKEAYHILRVLTRDTDRLSYLAAPGLKPNSASSAV